MSPLFYGFSITYILLLYEVKSLHATLVILMSITKEVLNETKNFSAKRFLCDRTLQFDNLYLVTFKHTHRKIFLKDCMR